MSGLSPERTDEDLWPEEAILAACKTMGWPGLRPNQERILREIFAKKDVVTVIPTGGGKSSLYQIPALAREGIVVVVSPLIALMQDQVDRLQSRGVAAVSLNSHCSAIEKREIFDAIRAGSIRLLYVSPERLLSLEPALFEQSSIQMFAIDEAHCISEWGHDFRPSYYKLGRSIRRFGKGIQILAVTATATPAVTEEIRSVLQMDRETSVRIRFSPNRPNITYGVAGREVALVRMVERGGYPCIVYGSTRKGVEDASARLKRGGVQAAYYHAGMSKVDRWSVQKRFEEEDIEALAATCAFGMGIDHAGIRSVIHIEMPTSLEAFSQETGRAGRDGGQSIALVRYTMETLDIAQHQIQYTWPSPWRVVLCWKRLAKVFEAEADSEGRLQATNTQIAEWIGMEAMEVGSCLRILADDGNLKRWAYQERPVRVTLLSNAVQGVRGARQKAVLSSLRQHADVDGVILGSVSFFLNRIGLDKAMAERLRLRHVIAFDWVDRCQLLERTHTEEEPLLDADRLIRVRARAEERVEAARGFLRTEGCRRQYLANYFEDHSDLYATGPCCDRCIQARRTEEST